MKIVAALLCAVVVPAQAQQRPATNAAPPSPALGCASLSNLRILLREAKEDVAAAIKAAADPKSDLGCSPVDRQAVTGIADHVALNGRAYECLSLQNTGICHWTIAGAVQPPKPAAEPSRESVAPSKAKPR